MASMSVEDSYDGPHLEGVLPGTPFVLPLLLTLTQNTVIQQ